MYSTTTTATTTTTTTANTTPNAAITLNNRDVKKSNEGVNLVNLLSNWGDVVLKYLYSRDIKSLRGICSEMCSMFLEKGIFNLKMRSSDLQSVNKSLYPLSYSRIKSSGGSSISKLVPVEAVVQVTSDLQTILKDVRFAVKSIVFKGGLENLKAICDLLPLTVETIEIAVEIPIGTRIDLSSYQQLKIIKVKDRPDSILTPTGTSVVFSEQLAQPPFQAVDPNNELFNSFIGVNKIPMGGIQIGWMIGQGCNGQVYRGSWGDRLVALKRIGIELVEQGLVLVREQAAKEDLNWEINRLSTVVHPNVVQFYGIYQNQKKDYTYVVMEVCEGGELKKKLERQDADITWPKRWQWGLELAEGLAYLHSQGILHRDLKADNVLLDRNDRAKLADLGTAQADTLLPNTEGGPIAPGAMGYIAPENLRDPTLSTKASDVYALGLVLWEIATCGGIPGFPDMKNPKHEREKIPADCPKSFRQVILDCWEINPVKRPSAQALVEKLRKIGPQLNKDHRLIEVCEELEQIIHPKRKEEMSYIAPFVTEHRLEESVESYWDKFEAHSKSEAKDKQKLGNPPLDLEKAFWEFIKNPGPSTLLLLGEAGLGKTLTTYLWADKLLQQWWAHIKDPGSNPTPAYLPLLIRPCVKEWSYEAIKGAFLEVVKRYNLPNASFLVFVDGYDELELGNGREPGNLVQQLGLSGVVNAKLIVSCRPDTVSRDQLSERFAFNGQLEKRYFLPFSVDQLLTYLKKELSWKEEEHEKYKNILLNSTPVKSVLRNPFILYLLKQSWETVSKKRLDRLDRYQIYEGFIQHVIEAKKSLLPESIQKMLQGSYENLVTSYQAFASHIAFSAFQNNSITCDKEGVRKEAEWSNWVDLKDHIERKAKEEFGKRQADQTTRRSIIKEEDYIQMMDRRRQQFEAELPMKVRGEGVRGKYEYSHRSFFEYFMAKRLIMLRECASIIQKGIMLLRNRPIQAEEGTLQFWAEGWKEAETRKLIDPLFQIIKASRNTKALSQASANAATLLAKAEVAFSGRDLKGVQIPGADLSNAVLSYTSLQGANLQGVAFKGTFWGNTDLREANLEGVNFGEFPSLKFKNVVRCVSYSKGGMQMAVGLNSGDIELYKMENQAYKHIKTLKGHSVAVNSVTYSPDGKQLASVSSDNTVRIWDAQALQSITQLKGQLMAINCVTYSPDGKQLAAGSEDKTIAIWDTKSLQAVTQLKGHLMAVNSVTYSPDGKQLASGSGDIHSALRKGELYIWNIKSQNLITKLDGYRGGITSVIYSPDGKHLAAGSLNNTVGIWDISNQQLVTLLSGHARSVTSVTYSPDGKYLASGSKDKTVGIWDMKSFQAVTQLKGHSDTVWSVAYSLDGKQLASGSEDKTVGIWDMKSFQVVTQLKGHSNMAWSVAYSPDGKQLASGSEDKTIGIWDTESFQAVTQLKGHSDTVWSVAYSPDGKQLASGSRDDTVGIWDIR